MTETRTIYNRSARLWERTAPIILSDFTARPFVIDWCEPIDGAEILDLGCGEGYVARQLAERGAASIVGVDISEHMIERAQIAERAAPFGIQYRVGSAVDLSFLEERLVDLAVAVFLFNYLTVSEMQQVMRQVHARLRPGGRFVFSVPHPSFSFMRAPRPPFFFDHAGNGYFSGRDRTFEGRIWRRDGADMTVRCVHKTMEDYFCSLADTGFDTMPELKELHATAEHLAFDPDFFEPLRDVPLHAAFRVHKW